MQLNVTSEIGRLKTVLVHLPGREIDVMVPPMMEQLLFDDILYGQVAREEHRRFQQLIRFVADEVFDIEDLLEEVFEDADTKRVIVRDFAKRNRLTKRLASGLLEQMERDMEQPVKRSTPKLEGGEMLVARGDLLLVGITERTNNAGVKRLARGLKESDSGVKTVIAVELPKQRSFMHLDTVFTFINRHECLIYPPVILPGGDEAATVTTIDLTKRTLQYTEEKSLLHALKRQKFDLKPIYCGGAKAVDQQREQWTDGANAFALAPGIILLYERNVRTAEELAKFDYHIVYEDDLLLGRTELESWTNRKYAIQIQGNELSRARGGPRCMTMPLEREDVP